MIEVKHGTLYTYVKLGCRCTDCQQAQRVYHRMRADMRRVEGLDPNDPRHGTQNGYTNLRCRCAECRAARAAYRKIHGH